MALYVVVWEEQRKFTTINPEHNSCENYHILLATTSLIDPEVSRKAKKRPFGAPPFLRRGTSD
jgi:hypothetical protein